MTVTQTVKPVDFVAIKSGDELTIEAADLAAEMLVAAYVPNANELGLSFADAYELAVKLDEQAADDLEASIEAVLNSSDDSENDAAIRAINMLLATAEEADREEREANGPWEEL